jgi:hypothetical protein
MLKICQKCGRAYIGNDTICYHCIPKKINKTEKIIETDDWLASSFDDLNKCTEGFGSSGVMQLNKSKSLSGYYINSDVDERFSEIPYGKNTEECFKLSLDSSLSPKIVIRQSRTHYHNREFWVRKPYTGIVLAEDAEERFIPIDAFRKCICSGICLSSKELKRTLCPAPYSSNCTYESVYTQLKRDRYKKFRLTVGYNIVRNGFQFRQFSLFVENVTI